MWTITVDLSRRQLIRLHQALALAGLLAGELALPFVLTNLMRPHP